MNLYHYTDLNAVHSILDTHTIRMTDIRFLNDKTEYLQGLEILWEASLWVSNQDSMYDQCFINALQKWFEKAFKELFEFKNASEMFYVASFSRSSDTLSQWRSYGMFAIEFNYEKMQLRVRNMIIEAISSRQKLPNIEFIECHYVCDRNAALERALELINKKLIETIIDWWQPDVPLDQNLHIYRDVKEILSMLATTFKHASFIEEQEVRLVIRDEIVSEKIRFRARNNILIPYYELELPHDVFSGVKIGPVENQKLTAQSLDIYNSHRATKLRDERYRLTIETSDIPYRTL